MKKEAFLGAIVLVLTLGSASAQESGSCTNSGNIYRVGDVACIPACHGQQRLARCDLASGQATWTTIADACPSARMMHAPALARSSKIPGVGAGTPIPGETL